MHARDRKAAPDRVIAVLCDGAGSSNVLHQEDASRFEAASNAGEDIVWSALDHESRQKP